MSKRFLVDTHVLLWFWHGDPRISAAHVGILQSEAEIFCSMASLWEIAIKVGRGKLKTVDRPHESLAETGITILAIEVAHVEAVGRLAPHHADPFDRMLVAQAIVEGMTILTADDAIRRYEVAVA